MTDIETIDWVLNELYNDGDYKEYPFSDLIKGKLILTNTRDIDILKQKILSTGFAVMEEGFDINDMGYYGTDNMCLTNLGIELLKKHGAYSNFLSKLKDDEKDLETVNAELDIAKKQAEIDLLKAQVKDYPNLIRRAKTGTAIAIISAIIALLSALTMIFLKK
jgi:hypothetical protein